MEIGELKEGFRFMVWAIYDTIDIEMQDKEDRFNVPIMPYTNRRLLALVKFVVNNGGVNGSVDYGQLLRETTTRYEEEYIKYGDLLHKGPYTLVRSASTTVFSSYWMYEIADLLGLGFDRHEKHAEYFMQSENHHSTNHTTESEE